MDLIEKLRRLTEGQNKARIARDVGLSASLISNYIIKRSIPRADIALKLAKVLGVSVEWLIDDTRSWPPQTNERMGADALSDDELLDEVAKRYRRLAVQSLKILEEAKKVDWATVARKALVVPIDQPLPREVEITERLASIFMDARLGLLSRSFDVRAYADSRHEEMPGRDRKPIDLHLDAIEYRACRFHEAHPALELVERYFSLRSERLSFKTSLDSLEKTRSALLDQLKKTEKAAR